jgi:hypothetical protein
MKNKTKSNLTSFDEAFTETSSIVVTINSKLCNITSSEKLNAKAESAKQMFANYRNKK